MQIGVMIGPERGSTARKVTRMLDDIAWAEAAGLPIAWIPRIPNDMDALLTVALLGLPTERIELGTAVVPPLRTALPRPQALSDSRGGLGPVELTDILAMRQRLRKAANTCALSQFAPCMHHAIACAKYSNSTFDLYVTYRVRHLSNSLRGRWAIDYDTAILEGETAHDLACGRRTPGAGQAIDGFRLACLIDGSTGMVLASLENQDSPAPPTAAAGAADIINGIPAERETGDRGEPRGRDGDL